MMMWAWFTERASIEQKVRTVGLIYVVMAAATALTAAMIPGTAALAAAFGSAIAGLVLVPVFGAIIGRPVADITASMESFVSADGALERSFAHRADCVGRINRAIIRLHDNGVETQHRTTAAAQDDAQAAIHALGEGLKRLAAGSVGHPIETPFSSRYEILRSDFNRADDQLHELLARMSAVSGGIKTGSSEISQASDDLSRRTEQQASSLEQTAAAMDRITGTVKETAVLGWPRPRW
jgi:methyl-accepting chemotaxis protein